MSILRKLSALGVTLVVAGTGCVTVPEQRGDAIQTAASPAWSLEATTNEIIVAVSPARQTLALAGSTGLVLGAGISAVSNARHRQAIAEVLQGYDPGEVFENELASRLEAAVGPKLERVAPTGGTAGYSTLREARNAHHARLAKLGRDVLLDCRMTYGVYGYEGTLIAKLEGVLYDLKTNDALWRDAVVCSSEDLLASDKLTDPMDQMSPNYTSPRFTIEDDAIKQWTGDGGAVLRARFESTVQGAVSALLMSLGLAEDSHGAYYLAKGYMNCKKFEIAEDFYQKALALDPAYLDAQNGLAVNRGHREDYAGAIALSEKILATHPDYGPAHYNIAWWQAVKLGDTDAARAHYEKALALGVSPHKKIDKALGNS